MRYSLSLGPFHPSWPGALRLDMEVEAGIVQQAQGIVLRPSGLRPEHWAGLDIEEGLLGIERLCAASSWAYTIAYCQALESLADVEVPPRAHYLRLLMAEMERAADHLLAAKRIFHLKGLVGPGAVLLDLREEIVRAQQRLTDRRFFSGLCVAGGVRRDLEDLTPVQELTAALRQPLYQVTQRFISNRSMVSSLVGVGLLTKEQAESEGIGGPVARASESTQDLRLEQPYAAYEALVPQLVTQGGGDTFARCMVLLLEAFESIRLLEQAVEEMPAGPVQSEATIPAGEAESQVESPTGPLTVRIQVDEAGRLVGLWRSPPAPTQVAALPRTLVGQKVEDIGVIVASWNLCPPCLVR